VGAGAAGAVGEPGRIVLADVDDIAVLDDATHLPAVMGSGEPQVVVRDGTVYAARLARVPNAPHTRPNAPHARLKRAAYPSQMRRTPGPERFARGSGVRALWRRLPVDRIEG